MLYREQCKEMTPFVPFVTDYALWPSTYGVSHYVTGYARPTFIPTDILGLLCPSWIRGGVLWLVNSSLSWSETAWKIDICWKSRMAGSVLGTVLLLDQQNGRYKYDPNGPSKRRYVNTISQERNVGSEVPSAVVMNRDIAYGSPLEVNRHFGGTYRLRLQGRRISSGRDHTESSCQLFLIGFFLGL
jgi:hypothetical protein